MELVYGGISDFLRDLLEGELLLSDRERQEFMEEVEALRGREPLERGFIPYPHYKEERRSHWAMMFARYFNERRREEGIQRASMARLLGVRYHALVNWERGTLPRDVVMYQKLDLMCPDLLKVLFGQCLRHPILLTREEREEVLETFDRELTIRRNRPLSGPLPKPRREL
jgi:DNA-binding XRE family transcriptional regulator